MAEQFDLSLIIKAIDDASPQIKRVAAQLENISKAAKSAEKSVGGFSERLSAAAKQGEELRHTAATVGLIGAGMTAAGAAIALPLGAAVKGYEDLQDHMARLATGMGQVSDKAGKMRGAEEFVKKEAVATGFSMDELTESLYQGVSGFLDFNQSMAVSTVAAKLARGTTGDLADTTKALTTLMLNFGDAHKSPIENATMLSDKMAALQTQFKFTNLTELTDAMKEAGPVAMGMGVSLDQTMAALATLSAGGLGGGQAGTAFLEIMTELPKAAKKIGFQVFAGANGQGIDFLKTLQGIKNQYGDISKNKDLSAMFEKAFGQRAGPRLSIMLQHLDKAQQAMTGLTNSSGITDKAFGEFQQRGTLAFKQLEQAMDVLKDDVGGALAPSVEALARHFTSLAEKVAAFAEKHPAIVKYAATFAAITAGVLLVGGALAIASSAVMGFVSFMPVLKVMLGVFNLWGYATKALTAAQTVLNLVMSLNPIGLIVLGVAALIVVAAELYEHWARVKEIFAGTWDALKGLVTVFYDIGKAIVMGLIHGIGSMASGAVHAVADLGKAMAHGIARFVVGHSPIPEGPLHDMNLAREIALTLKPAPVLSAIRRLAQVTAMAVPLAIAAPVGPALASSAGATVSGGGSSVAVTIQNFAPQIVLPPGESADPNDLARRMIDALRSHNIQLAKEVADTVERELTKRQRSDY